MRLTKEVYDLEEQIAELDGVEIHNGFPIRPNQIGQAGIEIYSACDDTLRYAFVSRDSSEGETPERWRATAYRRDGDTEGRPLVEGATRRVALRAAKDFVANVRTAPAKAKGAKSSGRVRT